MKAVIAFTVIVYLIISIPNSQAGVGSFFSVSNRILNGSNCDEPNSADVKLCRDDDGKTYYIWNGDIYKEYPQQANEEYAKKLKDE